MAEQYTPTMDEVREDFATAAAHTFEGRVRARAAFDAWLAEVRAEAWDEGFRKGRDSEVSDPAFWTASKYANPYRADSLAPRQEKCSVCGQEVPWPVHLHHAESDCAPRPAAPDNREASEPVSATFGHGSITLTWYPSSQRVGVEQRGQNAVMDAWEFVAFADRMTPAAPECRDCGRTDGGCDRVMDAPGVSVSAEPRRGNGPCNIDHPHDPHRWGDKDVVNLPWQCPGVTVTDGGA